MQGRGKAKMRKDPYRLGYGTDSPGREKHGNSEVKRGFGGVMNCLVAERKRSVQHGSSYVVPG